MYLGRDSHALIEQNLAWLELRVRVFCLRVSVLSVYAAEKASDLTGANMSPAEALHTFCIITQLM